MNDKGKFILFIFLIIGFILFSGCIGEQGRRGATGATGTAVTSSWTTWNPTLSWGGANPSGITTIARYTQIGKVVYFNINISSADSNGCTGLTISLPVIPKNNNNLIPVSSIEKVGA
jgi:hypothetical protein